MRAQRSKRSDSPAVSHNPRPLLLMPDIDQSPYKSIEITPVLYTTFLSVFFLFPQKFFWIAKRILAHPRLFSCPCASLHTISIFFPLCFSRLTQTSSSSLELVFFFKGLLEDASLNLLKMTHSLTVDSNDPRSHGGGGKQFSLVLERDTRRLSRIVRATSFHWVDGRLHQFSQMTDCLSTITLFAQ